MACSGEVGAHVLKKKSNTRQIAVDTPSMSAYTDATRETFDLVCSFPGHGASAPGPFGQPRQVRRTLARGGVRLGYWGGMAAQDDQRAESRRTAEGTDPNYPPPPDASERASHSGLVPPATGARTGNTAPGGIGAPASSQTDDIPLAPIARHPEAPSLHADASIVVAPEVLTPAAPAAHIPGMNDSIDELMSGFAEPLLPRKRNAQSGGADQASYQGSSRPLAAHEEAKLPPIVVNRDVDTGPGERKRDLDRTTLGGRKRRRRMLLAILLPGTLIGLLAVFAYTRFSAPPGGENALPGEPLAATATTVARPLATGVVMPLSPDSIPPPSSGDPANASAKPQGHRPRPTQVLPRATTGDSPTAPAASSAPTPGKDDLLPHL